MRAAPVVKSPLIRKLVGSGVGVTVAVVVTVPLVVGVIGPSVLRVPDVLGVIGPAVPVVVP